MATLRLERAGDKIGAEKLLPWMNKFRVLIDNDKVCELRKWRDSAEFEVASGRHTIVVKTAAGGPTGSVDVDFAEGEVIDLLCGSLKAALAKGMASGFSAPEIVFWDREE